MPRFIFWALVIYEVIFAIRLRYFTKNIGNSRRKKPKKHRIAKHYFC